jgi:hypothetical protein
MRIVGWADGHVSPKRLSLRPDDKPMTADDIHELHDEIASSDNIELQMVMLPAAFKRKSFPPRLALF